MITYKFVQKLQFFGFDYKPKEGKWPERGRRKAVDVIISNTVKTNSCHQ